MIKAKERVEFRKRHEFLSILPKNSICAEFGVYRGVFSEKIIAKTSPKKLYLVDPYWKKYGNVYPWRKKRISPVEAFQEAARNIKECDKNKVASFVIDFDIGFLEGMKDKFFDWVYLDSSHDYKDTLEELEIIKIKIKTNGTICGHDYRENPKHKHHGVAKAINKWLLRNKEYELYLRDNHSQWMIRKRK